MSLKLLTENEQIIRCFSPFVKSIISNQLPSNTICEDFIIQTKILNRNDFIIGVVDGYGGHHCGGYCTRLLPGITSNFIYEPIDIYSKSTNSTLTLSIEKSILSGFIVLDNMISQDYYSQPNIESLLTALSGASTCLAYITEGTIYVANIGDCSAFVVSADNGKFKAVKLTNPHTFENSNEVERIKNSVPEEEKKEIFVNGGLCGISMPLRAFGNFQFKWPHEYLAEVKDFMISNGMEGNIMLPELYKSPPYLNAYPEVMSHSIRPEDICIVMVTKGIIDFLDKEHVAEIVGSHISQFGGYSPNVVTKLFETALRGNLKDDSMIEKLLSLPRGISRSYRDDMTAVVVSFV